MYATAPSKGKSVVFTTPSTSRLDDSTVIQKLFSSCDRSYIGLGKSLTLACAEVGEINIMQVSIFQIQF